VPKYAAKIALWQILVKIIYKLVKKKKLEWLNANSTLPKN
jgi:hypothetical protein